MADKNILSREAEAELLKPISEHVDGFQKKIDALRKDGTDKVVSLKNHMALVKEDKNLTKDEKSAAIEKDKADLVKAEEVEKANKAQVDALVKEAEDYLTANFETMYYSKVKAACEQEKVVALEKYDAIVETYKKEHEKALADAEKEGTQAVKDENYVFKNKLFDAKLLYQKDLQEIKDRKHEAFSAKYHMIDLLRMSKFTFGEQQAQKREN